MAQRQCNLDIFCVNRLFDGQDGRRVRFDNRMYGIVNRQKPGRKILLRGRFYGAFGDEFIVIPKALDHSPACAAQSRIDTQNTRSFCRFGCWLITLQGQLRLYQNWSRHFGRHHDLRSLPSI